MNDLLKEAIADAKAVRETALANAKIALEEAFTPRIQSMLSAKLAEETEEVSEDKYKKDDDMEETVDIAEEEVVAEEEMEMEDEVEEPAMEAPVMEEPEMEEDLDLEAIIRELEEDLTEEEDMDDMEESKVEEATDETVNEESLEEDADFDINEIIAALNEEEDEEKEMKEEEVVENIKPTEPFDPAGPKALEEAYNVIRFMKKQLNEVNLLNAKLLFSNKLFRNFDLNESQKLKVIDTFDRTVSLREVKLVYSTLCESFNVKKAKKDITESYASKPVASTKPSKEIINESSDLANRFKYLAFRNIK